MAHKIKGVLFDMDGVLVNSEPMGKKAFLKAMKDFGVIGHIDDFHDFVGGGAEPVIINSKALLFCAQEAAKLMEKNGGGFVPEVITRAYDIYESLAKTELHAFPASNKVINTLHKKGYLLGICSSGNKRRINININFGRIDTSNIKEIVSGEDVARKKPFPDIYLKGAKLLGLEPQECIAIEDAVNGVKAAHAAGMKCIAITSSFSYDELEVHNPDYIVNDIEEVLEIIK